MGSSSSARTRDFADTNNPTSEEIYVMLPDGTHATRITDNACQRQGPNLVAQQEDHRVP